MKKIIATMAMTAVLGGSAFAQDYLSDLSVSSTFAYESEYIFRGAELGDSSIQPGVEFGLPLMGGDFYTGIWNSSAVENGPWSGAEEIDLYFGYAYAVTDMFTVDGGFTYYWYPTNGAGVNVDRTREFYLGVSADVMLSPAVYAYYDLDLEQLVLEASVGYEFDLEEQFGMTSTALALGAYAGMVDSGDLNAGQANVELENGYTYYGATADIIYSLSENVDFSFGVRLAANTDDTGPMNDVFLDGTDENFWWGTSVSLSY